MPSLNLPSEDVQRLFELHAIAQATWDVSWQKQNLVLLREAIKKLRYKNGKQGMRKKTCCTWKVASLKSRPRPLVRKSLRADRSSRLTSTFLGLRKGNLGFVLGRLRSPLMETMCSPSQSKRQGSAKHWAGGRAPVERSFCFRRTDILSRASSHTRLGSVLTHMYE